MDIYYDEYTTPLKFHKFMKYFSLPLGALLILLNLANVVMALAESDNDIVKYLYAVDFAFLAGELIFVCITLHGFYTWGPWGFWGMMAYLGVTLSYDVYLLVVYLVLIPEQVIGGLGSLIGSSIASVLILIYYLKRRPLFFENLRLEDMHRRLSEQPASVGSEVVVHLDDRSCGNPTVCRVCGAKLNTARSACMRCGTAIQKAETVNCAQMPETAKGPEVQAVKANYCRKCGNKLLEDSVFCHHCGTRVVG